MALDTKKFDAQFHELSHHGAHHGEEAAATMVPRVEERDYDDPRSHAQSP